MDNSTDKHNVTVTLTYKGTRADMHSVAVVLQAFADLYSATLERIVRGNVIRGPRISNMTQPRPIVLRQFSYKGKEGAVVITLSSNSKLNLPRIQSAMTVQFVEPLIESIQKPPEAR